MASNPPVESLPPLPELTTLGSSLSPDMITELIALRAEVALLRAENEKLRAHQASQTILPISIPVPDTANAPVASDTKGEITLTPPKQDTHSGEVQTLRNQVHTLQKAHELLAERVKLLETCDFAKKETNVVASPVSLSISPEEAPTCPFVPQTERKNSAGGFSFTDMLAEGGTVSAFSPAAKEGEEDDTIGDGSLSHKSVVNETFGSYCPDEKQRRKSALSSKLSSSSTTSSTLKAVISYDWNTLVAMKTGPWADITVDVSKQQLETVIASWNAIKNGGLVAKLGTSAMECLFSQNPGYKRLYADPSAFPLSNIVERIVSHSHRSFGKKQRQVVADILLLGWRHMHQMGGLGLSDFKCMVVAVTYGISEMRSLTHDEKKKEILSWQVLLREISVIMARGGEMSAEDLADVQKFQKGNGDEKQCKVM